MSGLSVAILDYGAGNVASVMKAFRYLGANPFVTSSPGDVLRARATVIPGVGHFSRTARIGPEVRSAVADAVTKRVPILGICVGLQWLSSGSMEAPETPGLGVFDGRCETLTANGSIKVPHVGWNSLERTSLPSRLLAGIDGPAFVYFCHSYALSAGPETTATTDHGRVVGAVFERDLVFGVQFHPEKSGDVGLRLLANFVRIAEAARC